MAYNGYLLKVGGTQLPNKFIQLSTYAITPNQRMESSAERDTTGELHRTTCEHTASKIEFQTPYLKGSEIAELNQLLAIADNLQRNVSIEYFDPETQSYKNAECYISDVQYTIYSQIENDLLYMPTRYAFIEY
uniref:YolD-like protein n=1 Tax=Siphoviridae sp. ctoNj20 TaxID=2826085 RepID=A0A8D9PDT1_9CAUD|nr:MAG TPA: YolD-like protein [Siphoviridae sp. ctoNj20]